jgi:hypothetical protein
MNRKKDMVNGMRVLCILTLLAIFFRNDSMEVLLTSVFVVFIAFYLLPHFLTSFIFALFKIKDEYGGTLMFDDTDPTDCKFRMMFNFDPEELAKEPTFTVNTQRTNLREQNKD